MGPSLHGAMSKPEDANGGKESFGDKMRGLKEKLKDTKLHDAKVSLIHKKCESHTHTLRPVNRISELTSTC